MLAPEAAIGRFPEKSGRSGVLLYLYNGRGREPQPLLQILTVSKVVVAPLS